MIPGQKNMPMATLRPENPVLSSMSRKTPLASAVWVAISMQVSLSSDESLTKTWVWVHPTKAAAKVNIPANFFMSAS
jgi:hypothetical protein